jgi:hypothetical protein
MKITEEYRKQNEMLHKARKDYGTSGEKYAPQVAEIAVMIKAESILDYGCGKQTLAKALPQFTVRGYDPAIPGADTPPKGADLVVCTDVLEHIEPECLGDVLSHLKELTGKVVLFVVCTVPASKTLPDGRNTHINLKTPKEWLTILMDHFQLDHFTNMGNAEFMAMMSPPHAP